MEKSVEGLKTTAEAIDPKLFTEHLEATGIDFYAGVPDSLLSSFGAFIEENRAKNHVIAANEGNAIGLAMGHYLATGRLGLVYLQNSGQGNTINPITSLADPEVYGIPMILLIGWRGEPGVKDEPQHIKQGRVTKDIFAALEVPHSNLPKDLAGAKEEIEKAVATAKKLGSPYALVVQQDTFAPYKLRRQESKYELTREDVVKTIANSAPEAAALVATTGKTGRELFEYREELKQGHERDFLTVGGMGHASSIAMGIALELKKSGRPVICLDGDGAAIMHMGAMGVIGTHGPDNLLHIVINNGAHDSVGGQPTVGMNIDLVAIAKACGYREITSVNSDEGLSKAVKDYLQKPGPNFIEVMTSPGAREDLGRPTTTPAQNRDGFMKFLRENG